MSNEEGVCVAVREDRERKKKSEPSRDDGFESSKIINYFKSALNFLHV